MKMYTKPTVEVKTFAAVNKVANIDAWLNDYDQGQVVGAAGVQADAITSYILNS